jgi:hypothetical protein
MAKISWRLTGEGAVSCNCAWGCPCQFNSDPTDVRCEGIGAWEISSGYHGEIRLDGLRFAMLVSWPGPIHRGNGTMQMVGDHRADQKQRGALDLILSGQTGGRFFEILTTVCPNKRATIFAPIHLEADREGRKAKIRIPGVMENDIEPIRNPVTGEEHRAAIYLPEGFEYRQAEVANSVRWKTTCGDLLDMEHRGKHAHLNAFEWSNE